MHLIHILLLLVTVCCCRSSCLLVYLFTQQVFFWLICTESVLQYIVIRYLLEFRVYHYFVSCARLIQVRLIICFSKFVFVFVRARRKRFINVRFVSFAGVSYACEWNKTNGIASCNDSMLLLVLGNLMIYVWWLLF